MECKEESGIKSVDEMLLEPLNYIKKVSRKQFRAKVTKAFNYWLNIPSDKCVEIENVAQMLYNATLLLDDIEDNSKLRGGVPAAHHIYGVPCTMSTANFAFFLGMEKTLKLGHPEAARVVTGELLELHRGQGMDIYWRDNFICPTEEEYKEMAKQKTGCQFGLEIRLMQLFSNNKSDFRRIIAIIGLYFQVINDYSNLKSKECEENFAKHRSFCEDITEGKFSFPVIHSIRKNLDDSRLMNIIRQRTTDADIKKYAIDIMEETGSFDYCRKLLNALDHEAREEIENLGHNDHMISVLDELKCDICCNISNLIYI